MKLDIGVVLPSMGFPKLYLQYNLRLLEEMGLDTVFIDNTGTGGLKNVERYSNVRYFDFNKNTGVNPAWNFGISELMSKYYLILNDDCLFRKEHIAMVVSVLEKCEEVGMVTFKTISNYDAFIKAQIQTPRFEDFDKMTGWWMAGRVSEYPTIDERLFIYYGDNVIYDNVRKVLKKRTVIDNNNFLFHKASTTVKKTGQVPMMAKEKKIYEEIKVR